MKEKITLFLVLLLSVILRLYKLDNKSIWLDEAITIWISSQSNISQLLSEPSFYGQQPFYYIFMHFWIKVLGTSEIAIRLPSVIFGILSVYMVYKLSRRYNESCRI